MQALVVRPPSPGVAFENVPDPVRSESQVEVRVLECGLCGTDRDITAGQYGTPPAGRPSLVLGHENLGRVLSAGPRAGAWDPGQLVVATVRRSCGRCRFCLAGRSDVCESGAFTERGIRGADGYLAERYVESPEYLVAVPDDLRGVAVLLEPLSVVEKAVHSATYVLDRRGPTPGAPAGSPGTALVAGTGAIGMLAAFLLRARGWSVTGVDRHDDTTAAAHLLARVGAGHANVGDGWSALADRSYDVILEASGSAALDVELIERLGPNGVVALTGIPPATGPPVPVGLGALWRDVVLENRAVVGSVNANRSYFEAGVADLGRFRRLWGDAVEGIIVARRPWSEAPQLLADRGVAGMKSVVTVGGG